MPMRQGHFWPLHTPVPHVAWREDCDQEGHEKQCKCILFGALKLCIKKAKKGCNESKHERQAWGAGQAQAHKAQTPHTKAQARVIGQACKGSKGDGDKGELRKHGGDLMHGLRQSKARYQGQEGGVRQGSCIIFVVGFTPKCKGHGLGVLAFAKRIHSVPGGAEANEAHANEGHARGLCCRHKGGEPLNGPSTQPIGQQGIELGCLSLDCWVPPIAFVVREFQHKTQGCEVHRFPRLAKPKPWNDVGNAKDIKRQARQAANRLLADNCWCWLFQVNGTF